MTCRSDYLRLKKAFKIKSVDLINGVSKATISRFENGSDITLSKFEKLVEGIGCEILIIKK